MPPFAFVSHSKDDPNKDKLGIAVSTVGLQPVFMEYEEFHFTAWGEIRHNIEKSGVLFVLLNHILLEEERAHTRNWIDFEVGIACERSLDVWVVEPKDRVEYNVPYLTHHIVMPNLWNDESVKTLKDAILKWRGYDYSAGKLPSFRISNRNGYRCSNPKCELIFLQVNQENPFICPACRTEQDLNGMMYEKI